MRKRLRGIENMNSMEERMMKMQAKVQIANLRRNNALKIVKHDVEGKTATVDFAYSAEFYGRVVLSGHMYDVFLSIGGFKDEKPNPESELKPEEVPDMDGGAEDVEDGEETEEEGSEDGEPEGEEGGEGDV
jgi:hypothetical protein